jgi:hypothetical protein
MRPGPISIARRLQEQHSARQSADISPEPIPEVTPLWGSVELMKLLKMKEADTFYDFMQANPDFPAFKLTNGKPKKNGRTTCRWVCDPDAARAWISRKSLKKVSE